MQTAVIKDEEDQNFSSCKNNETLCGQLDFSEYADVIGKKPFLFYLILPLGPNQPKW